MILIAKERLESNLIFGIPAFIPSASFEALGHWVDKAVNEVLRDVIPNANKYLSNSTLIYFILR